VRKGASIRGTVAGPLTARRTFTAPEMH